MELRLHVGSDEWCDIGLGIERFTETPEGGVVIGQVAAPPRKLEPAPIYRQRSSDPRRTPIAVLEWMDGRKGSMDPRSGDGWVLEP
jgi:hypothetical protein